MLHNDDVDKMFDWHFRGKLIKYRNGMGAQACGLSASIDKKATYSIIYPRGTTQLYIESISHHALGNFEIILLKSLLIVTWTLRAHHRRHVSSSNYSQKFSKKI